MLKSKIKLYDETSVYMDFCASKTIDIRGQHHVNIKSTRYFTMRVTAMLGVDSNGAPQVLFIIGKNYKIPKVKEVLQMVSGQL